MKMVCVKRCGTITERERERRMEFWSMCRKDRLKEGKALSSSHLHSKGETLFISFSLPCPYCLLPSQRRAHQLSRWILRKAKVFVYVEDTKALILTNCEERRTHTHTFTSHDLENAAVVTTVIHQPQTSSLQVTPTSGALFCQGTTETLPPPSLLVS